MVPGPSTVHVLVTAHPDDESLFFLPWIVHALRQRPASVLWLLCLTTGNYDGLGDLRVQELNLAAKDVLGLHKVIVLDDPSLADHPVRRWNVTLCADRIHQALAGALREEFGAPGNHGASNSPPLLDALHLVTFDADGVSGHVNHRDTFRAVQDVFTRQRQGNDDRRLAENVTAWALETIHNPIIKYIPLWEWLLLLFHWLGFGPSSYMSETSTADTATYRLLQPSRNWRAMATHRSQFVWYRRLFVVFSRYTYHNRLRRVPLVHVEPDRVPKKEL
jgi:N-acetylglucosaminylphosphatidylinositol deacetylase